LKIYDKNICFDKNVKIYGKMNRQKINHQKGDNSMSTQTATKEVAEKYIQDALVNGKLEMKAAVKELGWSFPRIRSKAKTLAKKLNGVLTKDTKGIYFLKTDIVKEVPVASVPEEPSAEETPAEETSTETPQYTAEQVEAAVMGNLANPPSDPAAENKPE